MIDIQPKIIDLKLQQYTTVSKYFEFSVNDVAIDLTGYSCKLQVVKDGTVLYDLSGNVAMSNLGDIAINFSTVTISDIDGMEYAFYLIDSNTTNDITCLFKGKISIVPAMLDVSSEYAISINSWTVTASSGQATAYNTVNGSTNSWVASTKYSTLTYTFLPKLINSLTLIGNISASVSVETTINGEAINIYDSMEEVGADINIAVGAILSTITVVFMDVALNSQLQEISYT